MQLLEQPSFGRAVFAEKCRRICYPVLCLPFAVKAKHSLTEICWKGKSGLLRLKKMTESGGVFGPGFAAAYLKIIFLFKRAALMVRKKIWWVDTVFTKYFLYL